MFKLPSVQAGKQRPVDGTVNTPVSNNCLIDLTFVIIVAILRDGVSMHRMIPFTIQRKELHGRNRRGLHNIVVGGGKQQDFLLQK